MSAESHLLRDERYQSNRACTRGIRGTRCRSVAEALAAIEDADRAARLREWARGDERREAA